MAQEFPDLPLDWGIPLLPLNRGGLPEPVHGARIFENPRPTAHSRPYLAINMVATVDGRTVVGRSAAGIGSDTDQRLMRRLRAEADAVLHGAGTLRADRVIPRVPKDLEAQRVARGESPQPLGAVISARGELPASAAYFRTATPAWPRLVYSGHHRAESLGRPGVEVSVAQDGVVRLPQVLADLGRRGVRLVLCEGGPTLNAALFAEGLVDELFLTLAPRLVGGWDPLTLLRGAALSGARLTIRSLYARGDELFFRYEVRRDTS